MTIITTITKSAAAVAASLALTTPALAHVGHHSVAHAGEAMAHWVQSPYHLIGTGVAVFAVAMAIKSWRGRKATAKAND